MKLLYAAAVTLVTFASQSHSQDSIVCMETPELEAALLDCYGEKPKQHREDGSIVWAEGIGGTWTLVSYTNDGKACTLAQGNNWSPRVSGDALSARIDQQSG